MPTGYTAPIYEGKEITFAEFAMRAARGMGALITMRDQAAEAEIPEVIEPSTYSRDRLAELEQQLAEYEQYSDTQWAELEEAERLVDEERVKRARAESEALAERYNAMIAEVEAWSPPTLEHVNFKQFMLDQLTESRRFDCSDRSLEPIAPMSVHRFREQRFARIQRDIDYHATSWQDEQRHAADGTEWIRALRESLQVVG